MFIASSITSPLAPFEGAGGGVALRSIDISPLTGVKPLLRDLARYAVPPEPCSKNKKLEPCYTEKCIRTTPTWCSHESRV
jgi:hypothetical protein